ncbi:TATA-box binding [Natronincola peptidivorans]|uniref:TATA-box binding n=1 Tax=Natronincola peptidivorans TaxID=426128 RepID=A0A1H9ZPD1_9FIRM|nr:YwmB family TATA-box binding protein [Natronincola peptidivorans]SES83547.1 TATA-box binding [Natronincola peptidivorans]
MKKVYYAGIIFLLFLSFFYIASAIQNGNNMIDTEDPMVKIFEESGADILEANITTTLELPDTLWSKEEVQEIKETLKKKLGFSDKEEIVIHDGYWSLYEEASIEEDENKLFIHEFSDIGMSQIIVTNTNETGDIITFIVYTAEIQEEKTSYIIIDIIQNKRYKDIVDQCNQSKEILEKHGSNIETTINLVGTYDGRMAKEDGESIINGLIQLVNGNKVEEVAEELYISTTVYTPTIPEAIQYGNHKVNLQLAMRYNDYEEKTYLYIANPLITLTY